VKICLIGNSHLATLKRAWDVREDARRDGLSLTFFGSSGTSVSSLVFDDGYLVPREQKVARTFQLTAGTDRIDLGSYDAFVFTGVVFEFRDFLAIFKTHVLLPQAHMRPKRPILSKAAFRQTVEDLASQRCAGGRLADTIRAAVGRPIVSIASPCPCESILRDKNFAGYARSVDDPFLGVLYEIYLAQARNLATARGWTFVPQDESTLRTPGLSLEEYSVNSVDVGWTPGTEGPDKRDDVWHMNARYGQLMLDRLLTALPASITNGLQRPAVLKAV
jgi:hypothetical protein